MINDQHVSQTVSKHAHSEKVKNKGLYMIVPWTLFLIYLCI